MNSDYIASTADLILVTGSNGFIGAKVVEILLENGYRHLRCFVRPSSQLCPNLSHRNEKAANSDESGLGGYPAVVRDSVSDTTSNF